MFYLETASRGGQSSDALLLVGDDDVVEAPAPEEAPPPPSFLARQFGAAPGRAEPEPNRSRSGRHLRATTAGGGEAPAAIKTPRAARGRRDV